MEAREAELSEHLEELRTRIIRALVYVTIATVAGWFLYNPWIYRFLTAPITKVFKGQFLLTQVAEPFMIQFQVSLITGVVIAIPLLTMELWGFVSPALTREERRPIKWIVPLCILLFAMGVTVAYSILPAGIRWFLGLMPPNSELRPSLQGSITFVAKMLLAFGVVFEMPVVLLFLAWLGIVDSRMLKSQWRYAVVIICFLAAISTPSNDAFSMLAMAVPLVFLYGLSILLIKIVERKRR